MAMDKHIFNEEQLKRAEGIIRNPLAKLSSLTSSELRDLAVIWCYYSGKIEGNTYTYVETETLLKDGITPEKRYEDAKMLKNLHNSFVGELEYIHKGKNQEQIDERTLFRIHSTISDGLVSNREDIMQKLGMILFEQEQYQNPLERAVFLHCNVARIQPFIDGNKRTSRMLESVVMMNADLIPVYSAKDADILDYRRGLIAFYETGDYTQYADYFLGRLEERLKEIE